MLYKEKGKKPFYQLIKALTNGKDGLTEEIAGVRGRHISGQLMGSTETVEVKELSTIPFPYVEEDMVDLEHKIIYYESSRGMSILLSILFIWQQEYGSILSTRKNIKRVTMVYRP